MNKLPNEEQNFQNNAPVAVAAPVAETSRLKVIDALPLWGLDSCPIGKIRHRTPPSVFHSF